MFILLELKSFLDNLGKGKKSRCLFSKQIYFLKFFFVSEKMNSYGILLGLMEFLKKFSL